MVPKGTLTGTTHPGRSCKPRRRIGDRLTDLDGVMVESRQALKTCLHSTHARGRPTPRPRSRRRCGCLALPFPTGSLSRTWPKVAPPHASPHPRLPAHLLHVTQMPCQPPKGRGCKSCPSQPNGVPNGTSLTISFCLKSWGQTGGWVLSLTQWMIGLENGELTPKVNSYS